MSSTQQDVKNKIMNAQARTLVDKYSKIELANLLAFYKDLDRKGNVYLLERPKDHYSLNEFLQFATGYNKEQLKKMLDMGFTKTDKSQRRSIEKYNRHSNLLALASLLAQKYVLEHNGEHCPRVKGSKKTSDLLDGKSGFKNYYPSSYIDTVKKFLNNHPINEWSSDYTGKVLEDFEEVITSDGETKYKCTRCGSGSVLKKNSRSGHRKHHCHPKTN